MKIIKLIYFLLIITLYPLPSTLYPLLSAAPHGANFLKFASDARSAGMGSAFVAAASGADALWWNPAALAESTAHKEASLMHNEAGEGIRHQYAAYSQPFSRINGGIGGSISYFSVSDIQGYSPEGALTEELQAYGLCISAASGIRIIDSFSAGLNLKLIKERLDTEEAFAFGLDAGGIWKTPLNGFVMGFNLQNMGSGLKFIEESSPLPLNLKLGSSYRFRVFGSRILLTGDVNFPSDYPVFFNLGMEYNIFELISLRCGYKSRDDLSNGLRLGGGVRGKNLAFDYAWMPRGIFENSHRISLTLHFGRKYEETGILKNIEQHFESGQKYFYAGKMLSAYREFTYITNIAPRHSAAREYLGHIELSVESAEASKKIEENLNRGIKYFEEGDLASAAALFNSILSLNPAHQQAQEYLKEIEERFEEVVESILAKGIEHYDKMEYDSALKEIEKVLALDPENKKAVEYDGLIREKQEELNLIKEKLKEKHLEKIRKRRLLSYIKKGENFYKRKDFKKAIISFERALKLELDNKDIIKNLADSHYITGLNLVEKDRLLEAGEHFLRCAEYNPLHKESSIEMDKIKVRLKERSREYNRIGLVEYSKRNFKKAIDYWEKAIEFDPDFPAPRENLKRVKKEVR